MKKVKKYYSIYFFTLVSFIFLILTNNYFGDDNINQSATSSFYYLEIANSFPNVANFKNDSQSYIHADRFLISYIIGFFGNYLNIKNFTLFFIFSKILVLLFLLLNIKIIQKLNLTLKEEITLVCLIIFNPYLVRYYLSNPVMLNDLIFLISMSLLILSLINKSNFLFYISITMSLISRQTGLIIVIAATLSSLIYKEGFINREKLFYSAAILLSNYILSKLYIDISNLNSFFYKNFTGLFYYMLKDFSLNEIFLFFFYIVFCYGPLILFLGTKIFLNKFKIIFNKNLIFILLVILGIFSQPILGGPSITGKNIIRLTSFAYLPLIYFYYTYFKIKNNIKTSHLITYIFLLILWSLHPTFSKFSIFTYS